MKETFYFPHDYNAIQDPKLMALLNCCGLEGIGIYWILIELLHQQPESKMLYKSYEDYIEFYGRMDGENEQVLNNIKQMLINIGLFTKEGEFVFSERVLKNKKERERISEIRSYAGKKSAESRANLTNVEQMLNKSQQGKEKKGKESKINISNDTEHSSELEYSPLEEEKKKSSAKKEKKLWDSNCYIETLCNAKREDLRIMGNYMKIKKMQFPTETAAKAEFGRNIKSAGELAQYPKEKRTRAVNLAAKQTNQWTLLTCCKYLNK